MTAPENTCALCGKPLTSLYHYRSFNTEFCSECYSYVNFFCSTPEEIKLRTIDELKALYHKEFCDICGKKVSIFGKKFVFDGMICKKCEKVLRPAYDNKDEVIASAIGTAIGAAISLALNSSDLLFSSAADDPMSRAKIDLLRKQYEIIKNGEAQKDTKSQ